MPCVSQKECYSLHSLCVYDTKDGILLHCADGTHLGEFCMHHVCRHEYKCFLSYCIPTHKVCDDIVDCPNADDEAHCDNMACPGHLRCSHSQVCVLPHEVCDGETHYPFGEDEKFYHLAFDQCNSRRNIISCNYTDIVDFTFSPAVLILNHSFSVFNSLVSNSSHLLEKSFHIKINYGEFPTLLENSPSAMRHCRSLRWLQLKNKKIRILYVRIFCQVNFLVFSITDKRDL